MPFRRPCLSCWRSPCIDESPFVVAHETECCIRPRDRRGSQAALQESGFILCTAEALLRTSTPVFEFLFAMPDAFGVRLRTHLAEHSFPLLLNRCKKSRSVTPLAQNSYYRQTPSPDHCAEPWSDRAQDRLAEVRLSQSLRIRFEPACRTAGNTIRPINTPGPHVRCTKTSPQQTDPPALS